MFKKSLLALALTGVVGFANAGTLTEPNTALALNGSIAAEEVTAAQVDLTTGTAYINNDVISFTFSGTTLDATATPTLVNSTDATRSASFVDITGDQVRFRVDTNGIDSGDVLELTGVEFKTAGAADKGEVKVSSVAISTNPVIGNYDAASAKKVATYGAQFSIATATDLDGNIDLAKGRRQFSDAGNELVDQLSIELTDNGGANAITETKITHVVTGQDLSYLMDYDLAANGGDANGALSAAELATAVTVTPVAGGADDTFVLSLNDEKNALTITQTVVGGATDNLTADFKVIGQDKDGSVLAANTFSVATTAASATVAAAEATASGGKWTLAADITKVSFMPFGPAYSQSVTVANQFSADGEITIDWLMDGTVVSDTLDTKAKAKAITDISQLVRDAAAARGITGNVAFNVIVNVNDGNAEVVAVYYSKADGDRLRTDLQE